MRTEVWTCGDLVEVFFITSDPVKPVVKNWSSQDGNNSMTYRHYQQELTWMRQAGWTLVSTDGNSPE
jgi:hypothetical protein